MSSLVMSARSAATSSQKAGISTPPQFKAVGVILAAISGILIGSSFVFKKKGLQLSQGTAGEGVGYLKSPLWWTGMIMMILGELCNFGSYAFIPAVIVTPLGALSVVICAILSSMFLKETLTFFGWIGCFLCIVGSVIIALNGPQEESASTIPEFQHLFLSVGFVIFGSLIILSALVIIFFFAPKYGKKNMLWYIMVCSLFGGLSVTCTQGLGSSIVTTARGNNQFKHWFIYFLIGFVTVTLVTEIYFLNMALALFNTAMVTPTYYVIFTFFTLVTSVVLYQGLNATVVQILTVVMAFLVICAGITILQMSKVDPTTLGNLDRKSTLLLQASRQNVEKRSDDLSGLEDPGMDALRGSFGAFGSIIRAKSVSRMSTADSVRNRRRVGDLEAGRPSPRAQSSGATDVQTLDDLPRLQLYDSPMPPSTSSMYQSEGDHPLEDRGGNAPTTPVHHRTKIKFKDGYQSPGKPGPTIPEEQPAGGLSISERRGFLDPISEHDKRSTVHLEADETPPVPHERFRTPPQSSSSREPLGLRRDNDVFASKQKANTASSEVALLPSIPFSVSNMNPTAGQSQDDLLLVERITHSEGHTSDNPLTPSRSINRSYPGDRGRTNSEDEIEAHESLVSHLTDSEDDVELERTPTRNHGGIRLVQSRNSTPRRS